MLYKKYAAQHLKSIQLPIRIKEPDLLREV